VGATDDHLQLRVLESLASAHNYNAWLASLALPYLGDDPIEVGSGRGDHAALWLAAGAPRITLTDNDPVMLGELRARFADDDRVEVAEVDFENGGERRHSTLVAFNVLEHIEDDTAALRSAAGMLAGGGRVVLIVPAFPFAMSRFDREIGHWRRYTVDTMRSTLRGAGLEPELVRYLNAPGLAAWVVGMKWLRLRPHDGVALRVWDSVVVPPARALERRWRPPFGQSVLAVARTAA